MSVSALSRTERLYLNVLFAKALPRLGRQRQHSVPLDEFKEIVKYRYPGHRELKKTLMSLRKKDVQFGSLDDDSEPWACMGWLSEVAVRDGLIVYEYSASMEQRLTSALPFTKLDLMRLADLSTRYGLALYELCKRFAGVNSTGFRPVAWWYLALTARPLGDSFQYKVFNRDILGPAIEEINAKTDLCVKLETRGRPVSTLRIQIQAQSHQAQLERDLDSRVVLDEEGCDARMRHTLIDEFGIWEGHLPALLALPQEIMDEGIQYLRMQIASGRITQNVGGYALKTLMNFKPGKTPAAALAAQRARELAEAEQARHKKESELELRTRYRRWRQDHILKFLEELDTLERIDLEQRFAQWLLDEHDSIAYSQYKKKGLGLTQGGMIADLFIRYLKHSDTLAVPEFEWFRESHFMA